MPNMKTQEERFLRIEYKLLLAERMTNKITGVTIELNNNIRIVYRYMLDRYQFFKESGSEYFDNQTDIVQNCGVSLSTYKRVQKELDSVGAIQIKSKTVRGGVTSNSYTVLDVFTSNVLTLNALESKINPVSKQTPKIVYDEDDPDWIPF